MTTRRRLLLSAAACATAASAPALAAAPAGDGAGDAALSASFDALVDRWFTLRPTDATGLGLDKGARAGLKARLPDVSRAAFADDLAFCDAMLARLDAAPDAALSPEFRTHKAVLGWAARAGREARAFDFGTNSLFSAMAEGSTPHVVDQQEGALVSVPEFLDSQHKIADAADADAYVSRVHALARVLDQETERVRADAARGIAPPAFLLSNAIGQQDGFLKVPPGEARLVSSFAAKLKAAGLPEDRARPLAAIVAREVYPAVERQRTALKAVAAQADDRAGVWRLKDGEAYYAWLLKVGTTTGMSAEEVHQLGLRQTAEIGARMDGLLKAQGLTQGSVGARMTALAADPKNLFPDSEEGRAQVVAYLNGLIDRVRPRLSTAFDLRLKAPVLVKPVPKDIQDGAALGYMNPGAIDGSRPSTYYINLKSMNNWPKFTLPSLTYHETVPGHAWQGAYLTETGKLPLIRTVLSGYNAYVEGWALYAEQLGDEIGMYDDDPLGRLGYLQAQRFRAIRLVVDTGLHSKRWTREQAIAWAVENSGRSREAMTSEIDRYCSTPGQACGYKVGHTGILRLREQVKAALGPRYDLRRFDDAIVEVGPMPLDVLDRVIPARLGAA